MQAGDNQKKGVYTRLNGMYSQGGNKAKSFIEEGNRCHFMWLKSNEIMKIFKLTFRSTHEDVEEKGNRG